jgi:hypothetical protein
LVQKAIDLGKDVNAFVLKWDSTPDDYDNILHVAVENLFFFPTLEPCWSIVNWLLDLDQIDINSENSRSCCPETDELLAGSTIMKRLGQRFDSMWKYSKRFQSLKMHYAVVLKHLFRKGLDVFSDGEYFLREIFEKSHCIDRQDDYFMHMMTPVLNFLLRDLGISLQWPEAKNVSLRESPLAAHLKRWIATQKEKWKVATAISGGSQLAAIQTLVESEIREGTFFATTKYEKSRSLLHYAALNDRDDVIDWLVSAHGLEVGAVDGEGVSVFEMARRAGASKAMRAISSFRASVLIPDFCARRYRLRRARREWQGRRAAAVLIQKRVRLHQAYQLYRPFLREKRGSWQRFQGIWRGAIAAIQEAIRTGQDEGTDISWTEIKADCDMYTTLRLETTVGGSGEAGHSDASESIVAVARQTAGGQDSVIHDLMAQAALVAEKVQTNDSGTGSGSDSDHLIDVSIGEEGPLSGTVTTVIPSLLSTNSASTRHKATSQPTTKPTTAPTDTIELSQAVTKWLEKTDAKYRQLFCRRMEQLAGGYRSYALSKRLSHCRHPIYESKLDAGQRILWTKLRRGEPHEQRYSILV